MTTRSLRLPVTAAHRFYIGIAVLAEPLFVEHARRFGGNRGLAFHLRLAGNAGELNLPNGIPIKRNTI
jgi:hypothetical protein